jgi:hypothetical protein
MILQRPGDIVDFDHEPWERWYAWYPRRVDGVWRFRTYVERRRVWTGRWGDDKFTWEYRSSWEVA